MAGGLDLSDIGLDGEEGNEDVFTSAGVLASR
jgi:hypothetical protein